MKKMIKDVDLILECRDFRVPAVSVNPAFEDAIGSKRRYIIYTKRDLGGNLKLENQVGIEIEMIAWSMISC